MRLQKLRKALGATRTMRGRKVRLLPLFVICLLMMGVAADLIAHYTVEVDTTGGQVIGDPYWTKFTDMLDVEVTIVPLPDVVQNSYADTDHYKLSLVNPDTRVSMVFEITGTINTGVTVEAYLEAGETDTLWLEGDNYAILMGDGYGSSVELYWEISASYDASVGSLGDFGFKFVACENPIIPFALSVDSITQGPGVELQDVATSTMQTTIDFGTITPEDPVVINEDYLLYGVDHVLVQYAWTGLPADVHIAMDWSDDLGSTWNVWATDVDYALAYGEELLLRFSITADVGSDHSAGLAVGLVLTESVAPFSMTSNAIETGTVGNFNIMDPTFTTVLTSFDFGTITQLVPKQYDAGIKCTNNFITVTYTWTVSVPDVTIVVQYSLNEGVSWITWVAGTAAPQLLSGATMLLRLTITASATANYPTGLNVAFTVNGV